MADRLERIISTHFDPRWGAPYWIERRRELAFDPIDTVRSMEDLGLFPPFPAEELALRPVTDFIPRRYHGDWSRFITSETGGTTGRPKRSAFFDDEFKAAFVTPFVTAAGLLSFPREAPWLFVGPSGPHVIGKAAAACARAMGSMDPFSVDFDPRWARKLPGGSFARQRYLGHVTEQAMEVLTTQEIGVIFSTPPVLEALAQRLDQPRRASVRGIHLGGMAGDAAFWRKLTGEWFPNAVALAGYGNSLAGVCPQITSCTDGRPAYYPHGDRLVLEVRDTDDDGLGTVTFHRLDDHCFLPNVVERDRARRAPAPPEGASAGFVLPGICAPEPPEELTKRVAEGLY